MFIKYLYFCFLIILVACSTTEKQNEKPVVSASAPLPIEGVEDPAIAIIDGSNCKNCHLKSQKSVGPSFYEIARKYDSDSITVATLTKKIKLGGSGVWGNVPMAAHPELRDDDIRAIATYITKLDE
jgi:cytochrome c